MSRLLALTFDDGPSPDTTLPLLDILQEYGVPATFFVLGEKLTRRRVSICRRALAQGCEIGNHSFSHRDLTKCREEVCAFELAETSRRIAALTGSPPALFRPPYFAVSDQLFARVPLPAIGGTDIRDYDPAVTEEMRVQGMLDAAQDGAIFLLHDAPGNLKTVRAVRRVIPRLLAADFRLVTVSALFAEKQVTPAHGILHMSV